jgi:hypothetical protein
MDSMTSLSVSSSRLKQKDYDNIEIRVAIVEKFLELRNCKGTARKC